MTTLHLSWKCDRCSFTRVVDFSTPLQLQAYARLLAATIQTPGLEGLFGDELLCVRCSETWELELPESVVE